MHYSHAQTPVSLLKWARGMAKILTKRYSKGETVPIFVYMGMSGIATVTALSMQLAAQKTPIVFGMMYVRKEEEVSHGCRVETAVVGDANLELHDLKNHPHEFVFVDDFICNGGSLIKCALAYQKEMDELLIFSHDAIVCMTGERYKPVWELTPMFGPDGTPSYKETPKHLNRLMLDDHNERVRRKKEASKLLAKELTNWP